ncbi:uncharacterized protein LOC126380279 [Pectinophora gossypiella]|uniref:uncharacterized protein LOC126380279 n=1 Tax=Pectinophora gossypiella TaxID=13191 RepID=UPI00214ED6C6|nr:uncharacterized protein LOC126380279 [Pectinophora gossypiella]
MAKGAVPGTFFWKPRLALDLSIPTTQASSAVRMPTKDNIHDGTVVLVDGYAAGMTIISLAAGLSSSTAYPHLNPISAFFYTNMYRWGLRYMSLIPHWMGGHGGNYVETHKVWRRRFYYMDEFMPEWMKNLLVHVPQEEWDKEYLDWKRFKKYSEPAFGKHYRYPTRSFNDFRSMETIETEEANEEISSESGI